ncbi:restriction endonuclease subunit S, partial [Planktothrix sp.]|uniref:restriction endonuclease subunit S n=1 Tax=Planktothrix sp. TaxID=3088171 RepID=UPI0038D3C4B3
KNLVEKNLLSLSYGRIIKKDFESNYGLLPESFETYQIVNPGNIILRLTDLQNDKKSLRVGIVKEKGIITSAYLCLNTQHIYAQYAYKLLHNYDILKVFYNMGSGIRQNMNFKDLKRLPILVPPPEEQKAIAHFLDHKLEQIEQYIRNKQRLIELLNEQKTAIINRAVTKGINPNVPMKHSGIEWLGEIPVHWEVIPLTKNLSSLVDYRGKTPEKIESGIFLVTAKNIKNGSINYEISKEYISENNYFEIMRRGL